VPNRRLERYRLPWVDLPGNVRVLPAWTPNAELWGKAQQQWLQTAVNCPCPLPVDPGGNGASSAGYVPDGSPGVPLRLDKNPVTAENLDLAWGASCASGGTNYSIHEGSVGSWYSHTSVLCSTAGALSQTITPSPGDRYYLIVPLNADVEGGYGVNSGGGPRPPSSSPCRTSRIASCP
jgi:hypothetical protein